MKPWSLLLMVAAMSPGFSQEEGGFHVFTDKKGKTISAKILSVDDSRRMAEIEREDGRTFSIEITTFSLEDQQFLRDWLGLSSRARPGGSEPVVKGNLRVFGSLRKGAEIGTGPSDEFDDIIGVEASGNGWIALRENGEVLSFSGRDAGMSEVRSVGSNTGWLAYLKEDGTVWTSSQSQAFPGELENVTQVAAGSGHIIAVMEDGTAKVWGSRYKDASDGPVDPPLPLEGVVDVATCQDKVAAVDSEGVVHCWTMPKRGEELKSSEIEVYSHRLGDGVVAVEGSIFHFLALTASGEVYEWASGDPSQAVKPDEGPSGAATAIRANGSTRAARLEDGSWVAWGQSGNSGIVEKIKDLGPVPDIAFFSEPMKDSDAFVVWIEP
mgnify:CR=1 FL=1